MKTKGKIIAFEPIKDNFAMLRKNVNGRQPTNLFPLAVTGERGLQRIHISSTCLGHSVSDRIAEGRGSVEVETTTLKDILRGNNIERINFLKMDCEGAEGLIFGNLDEETLSRIDKIVIEFHNHLSCLSHVEIAKRLRRAGFTVWIKEDKKPGFGFIYAKRGVERIVPAGCSLSMSMN